MIARMPVVNVTFIESYYFNPNGVFTIRLTTDVLIVVDDRFLQKFLTVDRED